MNTNDYYYYIHGTTESDYTKFFSKGLIDKDKEFKIESTMLRISDEDIVNGRLQELMTNSKDKYGDLWDTVFLIKIPKCYFPNHQHRDGTWDVPIPIFYERKETDEYGKTDIYPTLVPNLIQGCYSKDKGFITNPNFCPVFDPSGLKFGYEQLQPMRYQGYFRYEDYKKRNNADTRELFDYDKSNDTWKPFVEYYASKFGVEPVTLFDDESEEKTPKTI